eukprot:scaffold27814_cov77-Phaeocystis_antarctica.AAC.5
MFDAGLRQAACRLSRRRPSLASPISTALLDTMLTKITRRHSRYQAAYPSRPRHTQVLGIIMLGIMPGDHGGEKHIRPPVNTA